MGYETAKQAEQEDAMFFAAFILIAVVAAIIYFGSKRNNGYQTNDKDSPLEITEKQYARGEIDRTEFARRRSVLKGAAE